MRTSAKSLPERPPDVTSTRATLLLSLALGCTVPHDGLQPIRRVDGGADVTSIDACVPRPETCDRTDEDCDGRIDEEADEACAGLARGICTPGRRVCTSGRLSAFCEGEILPGDRDLCNGSGDEDCDGSVDEECPCTNGMTTQCRLDLDVGECRSGTSTCVGGMMGPCEGIREPVAEVCNGLDDDCDGTPDNGVLIAFYPDSDADGFGAEAPVTMACTLPPGHASVAGDCDDTRADRTPGRMEMCDDVDNDCDGRFEEGAGTTMYFVDADGDGFGSSAGPVLACSAPAGRVEDGTDCDDTNDLRFPGNAEVCDSFDNDCGGDVDEEGCDCVRMFYAGHTYLFCVPPPGSPTSRLEARTACRGLGYDLVTIESAGENTWLLANAPGDVDWWIGLRKMGAGYVWSAGGTSVYAGAPLNIDSSDPCFALDDSGSGRGNWQDRHCDDSNAFICEVPR